MRACLLPALLSIASCAAWCQSAPNADPLKSVECGQAVQALEAARGARPAQPAAQLEALRQRAADICFGQRSPAAITSRAPAPVSVPPVTTMPAQRPFIAPVAQSASPANAAPAMVRPPVITSCDTGGCWDSNGARLNRAGPALVGPAGVCSLQGNLLACPP